MCTNIPSQHHPYMYFFTNHVSPYTWTQSGHDIDDSRDMIVQIIIFKNI
jgi:hypothetical protein